MQKYGDSAQYVAVGPECMKGVSKHTYMVMEIRKNVPETGGLGDGSCNGDFDSAEILEGLNDSGDCEKRMVWK